MEKFEDHDCQLKKQEDVIKLFIDTGILIGIRRKLRSWCMLSRTHPGTSRHFKSAASRRSEQKRHLLHYYSIIHPFSIFNLYWEFYIFTVFVTQYLIEAESSTHPYVEGTDHSYGRMLVDFIHLSDILKLFATGYYDSKKSKVILSSWGIFKHYVITYFFFDILSCLNSAVAPFVAIRLDGKPNYLLIVTQLLIKLKVLRIPRCLTIIELFRQYMGYSSYVFKGIKVVFIFVVMVLWAFGVNLFVQRNVEILMHQNASEINLSESYYHATMMLLLVGFGTGEFRRLAEYVNVILSLSFGFALQLFIFAQILQVWMKYENSENKHHSLKKQFKEYVLYKEFPFNLRERIFAYFDFKLHKHYFRESDISNMISPLMKQEILLHDARNHIERVEFFRILPEHILVKVVAQLKTEIYLPGDVIISAGSIGTSMFFIHHGTVAIYTPSGKEICHLEDSAHFGEIALILSGTRVASVIAVTASELFVLNRSDFLSVIEPFPDVKDQLMAEATERLNKTMSE